MGAGDTIFEDSALVSFRAENARSFRDEVEFSLLATAMAEPEYVRQLRWREGGTPLPVLPSAAIFGANGSGKTNILKAMDDMRWQVLHSFRHGDPTGGMERSPFLLAEAGSAQPTRFEVDLVLGGVRHAYGFVFDDDKVREEWAYRYPKGRAALLFHREGDALEFGAAERPKGRRIGELLRSNALFLSTAASANHRLLLPLYEWFGQNLLFAGVESRPFRQALTTQMLGDDQHREAVLSLFRAADLGLTDAKKHRIDPEMADRLRRAVRILSGREDEATSDDFVRFEELGVRFTHRGLDGDVELDADDESLGTRVWFGLVGPVIRVLETGSVFLADELDASLHPALVARLVGLFQDPQTNPRHAQLVFNSHDSTLLSDSVGRRLLGRDQVWFTEKAHDGATTLFPLVDLEPRKQESIRKRYLEGRYGGQPILSSAEFAAAAEQINPMAAARR